VLVARRIGDGGPQGIGVRALRFNDVQQGNTLALVSHKHQLSGCLLAAEQTQYLLAVRLDGDLDTAIRGSDGADFAPQVRPERLCLKRLFSIDPRLRVSCETHRPDAEHLVTLHVHKAVVGHHQVLGLLDDLLAMNKVVRGGKFTLIGLPAKNWV